MSRIIFIDNLKGIAILLVVAGHVIQMIYNPLEYDLNIFFRYIYSFHMPLFFIISGMFSKPILYDCGTIKDVWLKISIRLKQLFIPFCTWSVIRNITVVKGSYLDFFIHPDSSLWFLLVLFSIDIFFYVGTYFISRIGIKSSFSIYIILFFLIRLTSYFCGNFLGLSMAAYYFPFFIVGVFLGYHKLQYIIKEKSNYFVIVFSFAVYGLLSFFWYRSPSVVPKDVPEWVLTVNSSVFYRYITAFIGSITFLLFSASCCTKYYRILTLLGRITLPIYVIHQTVIWGVKIMMWDTSGFCSTFLGFVTSFIIVLLLTLVIYIILNSNFYLKRLFLGSSK